MNGKLHKASGKDSKRIHELVEENGWQDEGSIEGDVVEGVTALKVVDSPKQTRPEPRPEAEDEIL